jgi:hypothetical protein
LVDISEGRLGAPPVESVKEWHDALLDKAEEILDDECLSWYGVAIKGCIEYAIDNNIERERTKDSRERARFIIRNNIVENLQRNFCLWDAEWNRHLQLLNSHGSGNASEAGRITHLPGTAVEQTGPLPNSATPRVSEPSGSSPASQGAGARRSFFMLFADDDEKYEER